MNFRSPFFSGPLAAIRPLIAVQIATVPRFIVTAEAPRRPGGGGPGASRPGGRGPGGGRGMGGRGPGGGRGTGGPRPGGSGPYRRPEGTEGSEGRSQRPPRPQRGETLMDRMRDGRGQGGLTMNSKITAPEVRVLDADKELVGIFPTSEALQMAREASLDLILIVPDAQPPVARMVELSKYKFEQEKAAKESRKRQKAGQQELKELRLRPNTDIHDYQVKLRKAEEFLVKDGDNVKITVSMKGREMMFKGQAEEMLKRFIVDLGDKASVMIAPKLGGNAFTMTLAPSKSKPAAKPKAPKPEGAAAVGAVASAGAEDLVDDAESDSDGEELGPGEDDEAEVSEEPSASEAKTETAPAA